MRTFYALKILSVAIFAIGCSATPKVTYKRIPSTNPTGEIKPDLEGHIKFTLRRSLIILNLKEEEQFGKKVVRIVASAVPTDSPVEGDNPEIYAMIPDNKVGVKTILQVTYIDNTRIIKSVGSEVSDTRLKTIQQVGSLVAVIVKSGILGFGEIPEEAPEKPVPDTLPVVMDIKEYERNSKNIKWQKLPLDDNWKYKIILSKLTGDSISKGTFFKVHATGTGVLPYSACRDATLYVLKTSDLESEDVNYDDYVDKGWIFKLKIADPDYVQTVKIPVKGKIDMHTSCGVNITNEKTETTSGWALISEVVKQASAIREAQKEAKKARQSREN